MSTCILWIIYLIRRPKIKNLSWKWIRSISKAAGFVGLWLQIQNKLGPSERPW